MAHWQRLFLRLNEEVWALEKDLLKIERVLEKRRSEQTESQQVVERAREESREIVAEFRKMQERIQKQDRGIARNIAQLNVLEGLQAKFEGFGEGAKAILGKKLGDLVSPNDVSILTKELKVEPSYTRALETLMGSSLDALYLGNAEVALQVIQKLDSDHLGRACLQIETSVREMNPAVELPDEIVSALSVISVRDDALKDPLKSLLRGCYFASDLESFVNFWRENPDFDFMLAATHNGEIIDCRGLILGGKEAKGKKSASVLEREAEIRKLRVKSKRRVRRSTICVKSPRLLKISETQQKLKSRSSASDKVS